MWRIESKEFAANFGTESPPDVGTEKDESDLINFRIIFQSRALFGKSYASRNPLWTLFFLLRVNIAC